MRRILVVLAAVLYAMSLRFANQAERNGNGIYILLDNGITASEAEELAKQEQEADDPLGFCFYGTGKTVTLSCAETGRKTQAVQVPLYGNGALLGADILTWKEGCMLDGGTARTLFGTDKLGEQQVLMGEQPMAALGTVAVETATVLVPAERETLLDRCVIAGWNENGKQTAEQFLLRHGLTGNILNFYPLLTFTKNLTLLPLWTLLVLLCGWAGTRDRRLLWLTALAGAVLLGSRVIVPKDAIPSMWSDFSFWGGWLQKQRENMLTILMSNVGEWTLKMEETMVKSGICALVGMILTAWAGRRIRHAPAADRG